MEPRATVADAPAVDATMDDDALLQAFRAGDEHAFTLLAERYQRVIHAACLRQAPRGEAEDCLQAVFIVLARRPAAAAKSPVLLAWLHRVAHLVCRDARRAVERRGRIMRVVAWGNTTPGNDPEAALLDQLDHAMLYLDERQRAAVLLHAAGNGNGAIARSLGVTAANASKLVQRGLAALRERLCRTSRPVGAATMLTALSVGNATAASAMPLTIAVLSSTTNYATILAKGTLMHLTITATKTWMLILTFTTTLCLGGVVAAEKIAPPTPVPAADKPPKEPLAQKDLDRLLEQKSSLDFLDTDLEDAVRMLSQVSGITLVCAPDVVANPPPSVTLKADRLPLRKILDDLVKQTGLQYEVQNGAVFISRKPQPRVGAPKLQDAHAALPVSIEGDNLQIAQVVESLRNQTGIQLVLAPGLKDTRMSMRLIDLPLPKVLDIVASVAGGEVRPLPGNPDGYQIVPKAEADAPAPSAAQ